MKPLVRIIIALIGGIFFLFPNLYAADGLETSITEPTTEEVSRIHLKSGDTISGIILEMSNSTLTIQSGKGFGRLDIPQKYIRMIEFPKSKVNLTKRYGLGYRQENPSIRITGDDTRFVTDQLSFKMFPFSPDFFAQGLLGYGKSTRTVEFKDGNTEDKDVTTQIMAFDIRFGAVPRRTINTLFYWGGSAGVFIMEEDNEVTNSTQTSSGVRFFGFTGIEYFFAAIPNLGMSGEIHIGFTSGNRLNRTEIGSSLAANYYF